MFSKLLLSATVLFSVCDANAQSKSGKTFASHLSLGPVVSLGHSWVTNIPEARDFKFAPAIGIGLVYSRNVHWGFGAQMLVSHEGYKQEITTSNNNKEDITINPVYLRMPLQVTYFFGNYGDRVRPKIYAGPSIAVRVDEKHYYSNDNMRPAEGSIAASDQFTRMDAGLTAGIGANIRVSRATWLNMDGGYYHGLVDVLQSNTNNDFNGNRNLRFNIGLMWGL